MKLFQSNLIPDGFLNIGPVQWRVHSSEGEGLSYSDPAYQGFWGGRDDLAHVRCGARREGLRPFPPYKKAITLPDCLTTTPLVSMDVLIHREAREVPEGEPLYCAGKNWALWEKGDDVIICSGYYNQPVAGVYCRLNRSAKSAEVFLDPARDDGRGPLRYPVDQILSWGMLAACGGVILHSAVVVKDGLSWVFIGRSGAGKTTLSELCFSKGWKILNDDRTMVFPRGDQVVAAGTPWHGSGRFAEAEEKPLGGVFVIEQSLDNRMESMSAEEIKYALLDVAAVPWFDDQWAQGALDATDALMKSVPFTRFYFNREDEAVQVLEQFCEQQAGVTV